MSIRNALSRATGVHDMVLVEPITVDGVVANLKKRTNVNKIYTYIGQVLRGRALVADRCRCRCRCRCGHCGGGVLKGRGVVAGTEPVWREGVVLAPAPSARTPRTCLPRVPRPFPAASPPCPSSAGAPRRAGNPLAACCLR